MSHVFIEKIFNRFGCPIHYWISNNNSKKWLVFLHGIGCDHRMFYDQIKAMPLNYNILLWDERGHGKSRPIGDKISFNIVVDDIVKIIKKENCDKVIFVGHSQGGQIAQEVAYRYPQKVDKLILFGSNCNTKKLTLLEKILMSLLPLAIRLYPWSLLIRHNMKMCSKNIDIQDYVAKCYRQIGNKDYKKMLLETQKAFHYEKKYSIKIPILFLYGKYDKTFYTREALKYWSKIKDTCECFGVRNAAHNLNQDNPKEVNYQILRFINS